MAVTAEFDSTKRGNGETDIPVIVSNQTGVKEDIFVELLFHKSHRVGDLRSTLQLLFAHLALLADEARQLQLQSAQSLQVLSVEAHQSRNLGVIPITQIHLHAGGHHLSLQLASRRLQPVHERRRHDLARRVGAIELGIYRLTPSPQSKPLLFFTGVKCVRETSVQPIFCEKGNTSKMNDSIFTPLGCFGFTVSLAASS